MGKLGGTPPEFLSTHPSPENRAARLKELGAKVQPHYLEAKANPPAVKRYVNLK
jgi:predicted Zn-dependent protease